MVKMMKRMLAQSNRYILCERSTMTNFRSKLMLNIGLKFMYSTSYCIRNVYFFEKVLLFYKSKNDGKDYETNIATVKSMHPL